MCLPGINNNAKKICKQECKNCKLYQSYQTQPVDGISNNSGAVHHNIYEVAKSITPLLTSNT